MSSRLKEEAPNWLATGEYCEMIAKPVSDDIVGLVVSPPKKEYLYGDEENKVYLPAPAALLLTREISDLREAFEVGADGDGKEPRLFFKVGLPGAGRAGSLVLEFGEGGITGTKAVEREEQLTEGWEGLAASESKEGNLGHEGGGGDESKLSEEAYRLLIELGLKKIVSGDSYRGDSSVPISQVTTDGVKVFDETQEYRQATAAGWFDWEANQEQLLAKRRAQAEGAPLVEEEERPEDGKRVLSRYGTVAAALTVAAVVVPPVADLVVDQLQSLTEQGVGEWLFGTDLEIELIGIASADEPDDEDSIKFGSGTGITICESGITFKGEWRCDRDRIEEVGQRDPNYWKGAPEGYRQRVVGIREAGRVGNAPRYYQGAQVLVGFYSTNPETGAFEWAEGQLPSEGKVDGVTRNYRVVGEDVSGDHVALAPVGNNPDTPVRIVPKSEFSTNLIQVLEGGQITPGEVISLNGSQAKVVSVDSEKMVVRFGDGNGGWENEQFEVLRGELSGSEVFVPGESDKWLKEGELAILRHPEGAQGPNLVVFEDRFEGEEREVVVDISQTGVKIIGKRTNQDGPICLIVSLEQTDGTFSGFFEVPIVLATEQLATDLGVDMVSLMPGGAFEGMGGEAVGSEPEAEPTAEVAETIQPPTVVVAAGTLEEYPLGGEPQPGAEGIAGYEFETIEIDPSGLDWSEAGEWLGSNRLVIVLGNGAETEGAQKVTRLIEGENGERKTAGFRESFVDINGPINVDGVEFEQPVHRSRSDTMTSWEGDQVLIVSPHVSASKMREQGFDPVNQVPMLVRLYNEDDESSRLVYVVVSMDDNKPVGILEDEEHMTVRKGDPSTQRVTLVDLEPTLEKKPPRPTPTPEAPEVSGNWPNFNEQQVPREYKVNDFLTIEHPLVDGLQSPVVFFPNGESATGKRDELYQGIERDLAWNGFEGGVVIKVRHASQVPDIDPANAGAGCLRIQSEEYRLDVANCAYPKYNEDGTITLTMSVEGRDGARPINPDDVVHQAKISRAIDVFLVLTAVCDSQEQWLSYYYNGLEGLPEEPRQRMIEQLTIMRDIGMITYDPNKPPKEWESAFPFQVDWSDRLN